MIATGNPRSDRELLARFWINPAFGQQGVSQMIKLTIEQNWRQRIEHVKTEAGNLPHGNERDTIEKKARQLETESHINEWLTSPGLRPPT
jgi:hypothetical protein